MATVQKSQSTAASKNAQVATSSALAASAAPPREKIAERAYQIWQASGRPNGRANEHWAQAERELRASMLSGRPIPH